MFQLRLNVCELAMKLAARRTHLVLPELALLAEPHRRPHHSLM